MTTKAPGRNDPCPCGSGVKYKKCCENREQRARMAATLARHEAQERERVDRYGEVRPPISTDFQDYKIVAVGNTIHWSKNWKTFPDFLQAREPAQRADVGDRVAGQAEERQAREILNPP